MELEIITILILALLNAIAGLLTNAPLYKHNQDRKKQLEIIQEDQTQQLNNNLNKLIQTLKDQKN